MRATLEFTPVRTARPADKPAGEKHVSSRVGGKGMKTFLRVAGIAVALVAVAGLRFRRRARELGL